MSQLPDQDFTQLDAFLADTMAGVLTALDRALNPSRRLARLSRRAGQESRPQ